MNQPSHDFREALCPCGLPWELCPWNALPQACPEALSRKIEQQPEDAKLYFEQIKRLMDQCRS